MRQQWTSRKTVITCDAVPLARTAMEEDDMHCSDDKGPCDRVDAVKGSGDHPLNAQIAAEYDFPHDLGGDDGPHDYNNHKEEEDAKVIMTTSREQQAEQDDQVTF